MNTIENLTAPLRAFTSDSPLDATRGLLSSLGICYSVSTDAPISLFDIYAQTVKSPTDEIPKSVQSTFSRVETAWFVGAVSDDSFADNGVATTFDGAVEKAADQEHNGMFVFTLRMKDGALLTRTEAALLTRGINRIMKNKPATAFIVEGQGDETRLSIATCERTPYKQDWRPGEKLGRVSILKGINCANPHRGHLDILASMDVRKCKTFDALYAQWQKVFSTDVLTKNFYREIQNWYFWAMSKNMHVQFPNDLDDNSDDEKYNAENLIRLITRMIFTWFMKEKGLVNEDLFDVGFLKTVLRFFDPEASVPDPAASDADKKCTYYRAILQNLFFATFNQEIKERGFVETAVCDKKRHQIKNFYRNAKLFTEKDPQKIIAYFSKSPFVNGGLFECLDNVIQYDADKKRHEYSWDGFSNYVRFGKDSRKGSLKSALIPDCLFFGEERVVDLSDFYENNKAAKKTHVRGLIDIFKDYVFTIEENTPLDEDVALDPELLGKVFENLLGCYNPETRQTARNDSGSFYTPREIVGYMVKSALKAYLVRACANVNENEIERLLDGETNLGALPSVKDHATEILTAIFRAKILDPACGSGAFPMGVLLAMVDILRTVDPQNKHWSEIVLKESLSEAESVANVADPKEREELKKQIEYDFKERVDHLDYARKLYVIEHCIFGSDLLPIAVQVSRLRFFITLLCEQTKTDDPSKNYGITPLPNLESNFVAANSLLTLDLSNMRELLKKDARVLKLVKELKDTRHQLFLPKTSDKKASLKERDRRLCDDITAEVVCLYDTDVEEKISLHQKEIKRIEDKLATLSEDDFKDTMEEVEETDLFGEKTVTSQLVKGKGVDLLKRKKAQEESIKSLRNASRKERLLADLKRLVQWNPFASNRAERFLDPEWMFGVANGFDIVIGNPPYVKLEKIKEQSRLLAKEGYTVYEPRSDLYCLFTERGFNLLKDGGVISYIMSNKWLQAEYGRPLRKLFLHNRIESLIDFGDNEIFKGATAYPCIFVAEKSSPIPVTRAVVMKHYNPQTFVSDILKWTENLPINKLSSSVWILSSTEADLLKRVTAECVTLKTFVNGEAFYGIKPGLTKAFVVDDEQRKAILDSCHGSEELTRTKKVLRLMVRGRDAQPYHAIDSKVWLVGTHNGYGDVPAVNVGDMPAIKKWLDAFIPRLKTVADQGDTPYNLRDCAYWSLFDSPKIMYQKFQVKPCFLYDEGGLYCNDSMWIIPTKEKGLVGLLNSKMGWWLISKFCTQIQNGYQLIWQYLGKIPVPKVLPTELGQKVDAIIAAKKGDPSADTSSLEAEIDEIVFDLYGLTAAERAVVLRKGE